MTPMPYSKGIHQDVAILTSLSVVLWIYVRVYACCHSISPSKVVWDFFLILKSFAQQRNTRHSIVIIMYKNSPQSVCWVSFALLQSKCQEGVRVCVWKINPHQKNCKNKNNTIYWRCAENEWRSHTENGTNPWKWQNHSMNGEMELSNKAESWVAFSSAASSSFRVSFST